MLVRGRCTNGESLAYENLLEIHVSSLSEVCFHCRNATSAVPNERGELSSPQTGDSGVLAFSLPSFMSM